MRAARDERLWVTVTDALSPCLSCLGSQNPSYLSTTNTHRDAARCQESWGGKAENVPMPCSIPAVLFWPPHRRCESGLPLDPPPESNCPNAGAEGQKALKAAASPMASLGQLGKSPVLAGDRWLIQKGEWREFSEEIVY